MTTSLEKKLDLSKKSIVICIPAYNEEKTIAKLIVDIKKYTDKIIVVDDGSKDYTSRIAKELGAQVIRHKTNLGKGAALRTCFINAMTYSPDVVITIDADGQHDPIFIPDLVDPIIKGEAEIVIGSRSNKTKMPIIRKMGLNFINILMRRAGRIDIQDTQSGYRSYSKKSVNFISKQKLTDYAAEFEILKASTIKGFHIKEVPIEIKYEGLEQTSKKNFITHGGELILAAMFMIIQRRPIIYLALPGTISIAIGIFFGILTIFMFNSDGYFSIPTAVLTGSLIIFGSLLILSSMFIYILSKMRAFESVKSED